MDETPENATKAVTSGSPIPPRRPVIQERGPVAPNFPQNTGPSRPPTSNLNSKAVIAVVTASVVLTVGIVALLIVMTQGDNGTSPLDERTLPPPAPKGPEGDQRQPRALSLEGFSLLLPANWNYGATDNGYDLGPTSNPSLLRIHTKYRGRSLQDLRPSCESVSTEHADQPTDDFDSTDTPIAASPTQSPRVSPVFRNVVPGTIAVVGGERADSEMGSYTCGDGELKTFNSILVSAKSFAMTFAEADPEIDLVVASIIFN